MKQFQAYFKSLSEFKAFEKEYDKQNCYDLSCEARDCSECEIFLTAFEDSKNEKN